MLRVIQTKSAEGAKSYYSRSDYLSEGAELVGKWGGKGALQLGLIGEVDKASFDSLCDNIDPRSGERLTLRTNDNRTVGMDFNFHAPKRVSLAYLVGGDERILEAFQLSVDETMRELEGDTLTRVRKDGRMEERQTGNLVWGGFDHFTTREVDGEADPHLHGHRMVFNATWDACEHAFKAVQFRELKRDASYYEAAFHARLSRRISEIGYDIERHGRDWDIAGIERRTSDKFSRRTQQIERLAHELDIEDPKQKDAIGATSRSKKTYGTSLDELQQKWLTRLDADEAANLEAVVNAARTSDSEPAASIEAEAVGYAKLHCFERNSVVPERKLLAEALRFGLGKVDVESVYREMLKQGIITRKLDGRMWATTREMLQEESDMLEWAQGGKNSVHPLNDNWTIQRDWLNEDQRAAVQHVIRSPDRLVMILGGAGTGKTAMMRETVDAIETGGHRVFAFAPSAEASRDVLAKEGFDATTVAELLVNTDLQSNIRGQVIWIDESGLLGTRTMKSVMDLADRLDARLILSGDWRQHGSVEAGAAMRLIQQQGGIEPALVRKIQRQDGAYREAVALLARGESKSGLNALQSLGWVHEIEDEEERLARIAKSFADGIDAGESVLAVAPTHAEADLLHSQIRSELTERGVIAASDAEYLQLQPKRLTEAERSDPNQLSPGDIAVFHRKAGQAKKDSRVVVTDDNVNQLARHAKSFEVYRKRSTRLAKGDFVRFTRNGRTKDGTHALHNGSVYRIKSFNKHGDLILNNGWVVDRDYGFVGSGYVSTSHASQGKTVDRVLIAESSMSYPAASAEQFYVSASRARQRVEVFTDDVEGLKNAISKTDDRLSAIEMISTNPTERTNRQRRQQLEIRTEQAKELQHERL